MENEPNNFNKGVVSLVSFFFAEEVTENATCCAAPTYPLVLLGGVPVEQS